VREVVMLAGRPKCMRAPRDEPHLCHASTRPVDPFRPPKPAQPQSAGQGDPVAPGFVVSIPLGGSGCSGARGVSVLVGWPAADDAAAAAAI
jgi:hypothetical protein